MSHSHRSRSGLGLAIATTAALLSGLLPASMSTASAKPPAKPELVRNLVLSVSKPGASYRIHATWDAANRATKYQVTMTNTAGLLDQGTVTTTAFTGTVAAPVSSIVKVSVVPFNTTRRGRATNKSVVLPDLTAPVAGYSITQKSADGNVTIEQTSLSDDLSTPANVTQTIDWGDGTPVGPPEAGSTTVFSHAYGTTPTVYYPQVTVADEAGNDTGYDLTTVVADDTAPTGTFSVSPATAWASWTTVTLTQLTLDDDLSAADEISRSVDWGDGSSELMSAALTATHRYTTADTFTPTVTIADEAGNSDAVATSGVVVTVDTLAPRVRLTLPKVNRSSVSSWKTLRGHARDTGTGVRLVRVRAIEKRGSFWYA